MGEKRFPWNKAVANLLEGKCKVIGWPYGSRMPGEIRGGKVKNTFANLKIVERKAILQALKTGDLRVVPWTPGSYL